MDRTRRINLLWLGALTVLALPLTPGCDINKIAADQTASLLQDAAPAVDGFWDYEIAGIGTPGAIMQLEAMLFMSPNNEDLGLNLAKAYVGYGVGWLEAEVEAADAEGDFEKSDRLRHRVRLVYLRARNLALRTMRNRDPQIDQMIAQDDSEALSKYLEENYRKKSDVGPIFWCATAWGAAINQSLDKPELLADIPIPRAMMMRVEQLDPSYFLGAAYVFLGALEAGLPAALGGQPEKGKDFFEKGLKLTKRRNHMLHLQYARSYAIAAQDKELYVSLLMEIISSPDLGNDVRMNNKIARMRAERYIGETEDLFD